MGTAEILQGWALQGYLVVGHCRVVGGCRDIWWLGTAGTLCGGALHGHLVVGRCRDSLRLGTAVRLRVEGEDNIDFEI